MPTVEELLKAAHHTDDDDVALAKYVAALELDSNDSRIHYNIGLIHKYRGQWRDSFKYNKRAFELDPSDEASRWNLAIAATALRDWKTARDVWKLCGMTLQGEEGPIADNFGTTPIRLDPDGKGEVVWAQRLCPVRARILNLPFPESGVAYGDVVLHEGAPVGSRLDSAGKEKSVFNMLEMFEPGNYSTYVVNAQADSKVLVQALEALCEERGMAFEDWHASVNPICRACSEGRPHERHEHEIRAKEWNPERLIGIGARRPEEVEAVLEAWNGEVRGWGVELERPPLSS